MSMRDYIGERHEDIDKVSLDGKQNVYMLVDNYLWSFENINKENQQKYLEIAEKYYDIWHEKVINLSQKISSNRAEFQRHINASRILFEHHKALLQKEQDFMRSQQKMPIEYPYKKIERLEAQLEFVKNNASFLSPNPRPRELIHGLIGLSGTRGEGVIIGILDYFPTNLSSTPNDLLSKVTNPKFNGSIKPENENSLHGICVASISASQEIGIAQDAQLEYLDIKMMDIVNGTPTQFLFGSAICQN